MGKKRGSRRGGRKVAKKAAQRPSEKLVVTVAVLVAAAIGATVVYVRGDSGVSGSPVDARVERPVKVRGSHSDAADPGSRLFGFSADGVTPEFSHLVRADGRLTKVYHHYWLTGAEPPEEQVRLTREWGSHAWSLVKRTDGLTPLATEVNQKIGGLNVSLVGPGNVAVLVDQQGPWSSDCRNLPALGQLSISTPNRLGVDWSVPQRSFPLPNLLPSGNFIRLPSYRMTDALLSSVLIHELGHFVRY